MPLKMENRDFKGKFMENNERGVFVSEDNIVHAQMRRAARNRISVGQGTEEDYRMIAETEELIRSISNRDGG